MSVQSILESIGYIGVFLSVFIECGVPLGLILPLPGYSLLFAAGVFAAAGHMNIYIVIIVGIVAAVLGYIVGYYTGIKYGRKLFFEKNTKKYFTEAQGKKAEKFMKRFGYLTLIIGRFIALVHNIAPILSGVARTPFLKFMVANVIGAVIWVLSAVFLGYFVGQKFPSAYIYVIPLIVFILIVANSRTGRKFLRTFLTRIDQI